MNKLTKKEQKIVALQKKLRPLSKTDICYIEQKLNVHHGVIRRGKFYCIDCNKTTEIKALGILANQITNAKIKKITCPHCGNKLEILTRDKEWYYFNQSGWYHQFNYITYAVKVDNYQIFRTFIVHKTQKTHRDKEQNKKAYIDINEAFQHWYDENLNLKIYRKHKVQNAQFWSADPLQWTFEKKKGYYGYDNGVSTTDYGQFKIKSLQPWLVKRSFINPEKLNISAEEEIENLKKTGFETLIKEHRIELLKGIIHYRRSYWEKYWCQIKIANRHNYNLKEEQYGQWFDMIDALKELEKDTHNPVLICPKDLKKAHDEWHQKVTRMRQHKWEEKQRKRDYEKMLKMRNEELNYKTKIAKVKNLIIKDKNIIIKPLQTIEEFYSEGLAMHHCVFSNSYYKKPKSLILSARSKINNERIATIEYDTEYKKILQCYAAYNKIPEQNEEIRNLIMKNKKKLVVAA